ncbi:Demethylmenaquinone methyltransferase [compost metagenome]
MNPNPDLNSGQGQNQLQNSAEQRAVLTNSGIIDARSLEQSHKRLAEIIQPGMTVLDVGCGTGAITHGIVDMVGSEGMVIGIDNNPDLIEKACQNYSHISNLRFEVRDIYSLPYENQFDIVTSARVLQWLSSPFAALEQMTQSAKIGGRILVLDYNHEKMDWKPEVPDSMRVFYTAFLKWRSDAGMDNAIADHLKEMFEAVGLQNIQVTPQHELVEHHQPNFQTQTLIWAGVSSFKGEQMVQECYIEEGKRAKAEHDYRKWVEEEAKSQCMYLLSVEGIK